jgi:hypothetical protein
VRELWGAHYTNQVYGLVQALGSADPKESLQKVAEEVVAFMQRTWWAWLLSQLWQCQKSYKTCWRWSMRVLLGSTVLVYLVLYWLWWRAFPIPGLPMVKCD